MFKVDSGSGRHTVDEIVARLSVAGPVRARAMFGGHGIYHEDVMFGLVADGVLYLKVDATNREQFRAANLDAFVYIKEGRPIVMSYHRAPDAIYGDDAALGEWVFPAIEAARRAKKQRK